MKRLLNYFTTKSIELKFIVIFVLLIFSGQNMAAQDQIKDNNLEFSFFNDSWGGGIVRMPDDLRTFGFVLRYTSKDKISIYAKYSAMTNRFGEIKEFRNRFDEIVLKTYLPVLDFAEGQGYLGLNLGVYATGDFYGEEMQNFLHEKYEIPTIVLPYTKDRGYHYLVGFYFSRNLIYKPINHKKYLQFKLNISSEYSYNYLSLTDISIPIFLRYNNSSKYLSIRTGYKFTNNLSENKVLDRVLLAESGINFNVKVGLKNIFLFFEYFPKNGYSKGGFSFRLNKDRNANKSQNLTKDHIEVTVLNKGYGYNLKYLRDFTTFKNRDVRIIVNHNFHSLIKRYIIKYPQFLGHGIQFTIGCEVDLMESKGIFKTIKPYANLSSGYKLLSIYSGLTKIERINFHHFVVMNDTGVKLYLPIKFLPRKPNFNFLIYHRLLYLSSVKKSDYTRRTWDPHKTFQSRWGLGMIFDF